MVGRSVVGIVLIGATIIPSAVIGGVILHIVHLLLQFFHY